MNTYMQSVCVFFNTEIVKNNSLLASPYEMVKNGTWMLDNFYRSALDAKSDANGDGVFDRLRREPRCVGMDKGLGRGQKIGDRRHP